jgi:hypothetical protein
MCGAIQSYVGNEMLSEGDRELSALQVLDVPV